MLIVVVLFATVLLRAGIVIVVVYLILPATRVCPAAPPTQSDPASRAAAPRTVRRASLVSDVRLERHRTPDAAASHHSVARNQTRGPLVEEVVPRPVE